MHAFHIEKDLYTHALARRSSRLYPRTAHAHICTLARACCVRLPHSGPGRAMTGRRVRRDPEGRCTWRMARSCSTAWPSPTQARCSSRTAAHGWRGRPGLGGPAARAALRRRAVHGRWLRRVQWRKHYHARHGGALARRVHAHARVREQSHANSRARMPTRTAHARTPLDRTAYAAEIPQARRCDRRMGACHCGGA